MSITDNVMLCSNVSNLFSFIVVKPYGSGHYINGMNVSGNTFRAVGLVIQRGERVDTSYSQMVMNGVRGLSFVGNTYHNIESGAQNPLVVKHSQNTHAQVWEIDSLKRLPFAGRAMQVDSVVTTSRPRNASNVSNYAMPYTQAEIGSNGDKVQLIWPEPMLGDVAVTMRSDK